MTRYNKPYVTMGPAVAAGVRVGKRAGEALKPCFEKDPTGGRWLKALHEDREDR